MLRHLLAALLIALWLPCVAFAQGKRIALVIGNSGYRSVERLANPANDARLIADTLQKAGFLLVGGGVQTDVDKVHFDRLIQAFGRTIQGADVALFYYSGHGMQVNGVNWLVPVDANPTGPRDLDFQMVDANLVLRQMEGAGTKLNLVLLDACRNNPFVVRGIRASGGGLAEMQAPEGTLISYATQPGNVAADGSGQDSPYTIALVNAMRQPGIDIFRVFNEVGLSVKRVTGGAQQPWLASSPISGSFYFFNNGAVSILLPQVPMPSAAPPGAYPPLAAAPSDRFDGVWAVTEACDPYKDALPFRRRYAVRVTHGELRGWIGQPGTPGYDELEGAINPDGSAQLITHQLTGDAAHSAGLPAGTPLVFVINTSFSGNGGAGAAHLGPIVHIHLRPAMIRQ